MMSRSTTNPEPENNVYRVQVILVEIHLHHQKLHIRKE